MIGIAERWDLICLPAIAGHNDPIGRDPGQALWPTRYDEQALAITEASVGPYVWAALYQQTPRQPGGTIFQRDWWDGRNRWDVAEEPTIHGCVGRYLSWDTASKDKVTNAYTAVTVGELTADYRLRIRRVWRDRMEFPALPGTIERLAREYNHDGRLRGVIIEDKSTGTSAYQTLRQSSERWLADILIPFMPSGDKAQRAGQAAVWCRNGCVDLPWPSRETPWLHDFTEELYGFPHAAFADQVDSFSQLIIYLEHFISQGWHSRARTAA